MSAVYEKGPTAAQPSPVVLRRWLGGVLRTLAILQGHPKLLEMADGMASDPSLLERQVSQTEEASEGRETLGAFFETGETRQADEAWRI